MFFPASTFVLPGKLPCSLGRSFRIICFWVVRQIVAWTNTPSLMWSTTSNLRTRGAARNFVRVGPVTDVVRSQTLAVLHKDHFDVTGQFLVCYNRIWRQNIFYQSASINFNKDKKTFAFAVIIIKQLLTKQFSMNIKRSRKRSAV